MKITVCPISDTDDSVEFLNLGEVPLVNNLCATRDEALSCQKFPLAIQMFKESRLVMLTDIVNKDSLFLNYLYQSGVNKPYVDHCSQMYDYLSEYVLMGPLAKIVDIGGNDGTLLKQFRDKNSNPEFINVDASESFQAMNEAMGLKYVNEFFGEDSEMSDEAMVITSTNVLQHSLPVRSFIRGVRRNLHRLGVWCLEFPYLLTTLMTDNYDQVYHEHVYYFLLKNINDLCLQEKLRIVNVSYHDIHAGTLRVLIVRDDSFMDPDSSVESFLRIEKMITPEYCVKWGKLTMMKIDLFRKFVKKLHGKNKVIVGFGAAAKGCVFMNTVGIDYKIMPYIIDDTPFKQGKFVPGTGIEIVSRDILKILRVDFILILAHNFKDYIIDSLKGQYDGKYIIMFPDIQII